MQLFTAILLFVIYMSVTASETIVDYKWPDNDIKKPMKYYLRRSAITNAVTIVIVVITILIWNFFTK